MIVVGCSVHTTDPKDAFKYWAGFDVPEEFEVVHGQYYKSPHFTYEFEVYLVIRPTDTWWESLIDQYGLSADYQAWVKSVDAPTWFNPPTRATMFSRHQDFDQSRFFRDESTGLVYIYEVQF